jgi:uncharacterized cupredoxin-like copper-binding protein
MMVRIRKALKFLVLAMVLAAGVLSIACGGGSESESALVIKASDQLRFEPSNLTVKVGDTVRIRLDNTKGATLHDLSIDAIPASKVNVGESSEHAGHGAPIVVGTPSASQLHIAAAAGKSAVVEFVPTQPGRYAFYCSVSGHRQGGMEGVIIVEPS